jgi:hypothetical protein
MEESMKLALSVSGGLMDTRGGFHIPAQPAIPTLGPVIT